MAKRPRIHLLVGCLLSVAFGNSSVKTANSSLKNRSEAHCFFHPGQMLIEEFRQAIEQANFNISRTIGEGEWVSHMWKEESEVLRERRKKCVFS